MHRNRQWLTVVVVAVLLAGALWLGRRGGGPLGALALRQDRAASELVVPAAPPATGVYRFERKNPDGTPVAFDPCRTIHYVVRVGSGPLNGVDVVREGVARLERATGLRFTFDGTTDRVPQSGDGPMDPSEPVFIGWATDAETDLYRTFAHEVIGVAGAQPVRSASGREAYVSGYVVLKPYLDVLPGFGPGATEGNVLLHELGHLAGLDHVDSWHEQMYGGGSSASTPDGYGAGDLAGLYRLGASRGCG